MRELANANLLIDRIRRSSGIEIEVISGEEEARLIHLAVSQSLNLKDRHALLIDIGGGSVEVTLSQNGNILSTESYNMGTVRLLKKLSGEKTLRCLFINWCGNTLKRRVIALTVSLVQKK
ncbi:hypothetical protein [Candidatus Villigracilis saccharophilus]|uniref:Ppx/GppA phosphatase family protein n=1 Tax=Candidatus Villigracilis saccharophilus TaxID=3140684 RepID=UPI003135C625|nr:hypothetical protein [Anaerolineales bacterium]